MEKAGFFAEAASKMEREIDSWNALAESLGAEDRELFKEMLQRSASIEASDAHATEALLINLLVSQQKTIDRLSKEIATKKKRKLA